MTVMFIVEALDDDGRTVARWVRDEDEALCFAADAMDSGLDVTIVATDDPDAYPEFDSRTDTRH